MSRRQHVHANTERRELQREGFHISLQTRFRGAVGALAVSGAKAHRRADDEHGAVLLRHHQPGHGAAGPDACPQVGVQSAVPCRGSDFCDGLVPGSASIAHEQIEASPASHGCLHHTDRIRFLADIGANSECIAAEAMEGFEGCRVGFQIGDREPDTLARQGRCNGESNPSGASRNESAFAGQSCVQQRPPRRKRLSLLR